MDFSDPPKPADAASAFFHEHASYSYRTGATTAEQAQARQDASVKLARAEAWAREAGISFHWSIDDHATSADWCDEKPAYEQWCCTACGPDGEWLAGLGGVDFGRDGSPWIGCYRRLVEAELAVEAFLLAF